MPTNPGREELLREIDALQRAVGEVQRTGDERHIQNIKRFEALEMIPTKLDAMEKSFAENTALTKATNVDLATLIALLKFGRGAMTLGQFLKKAVIWLSQVGAAFAVLYGLWLWATGRAPFPGPGH